MQYCAKSLKIGQNIIGQWQYKCLILCNSAQNFAKACAIASKIAQYCAISLKIAQYYACFAQNLGNSTEN